MSKNGLAIFFNIREEEVERWSSWHGRKSKVRPLLRKGSSIASLTKRFKLRLHLVTMQSAILLRRVLV